MTGDSMDSVAVVVCAYTEKRLEILTACLSQVVRQAEIDDEVVLVVDHNEGLRLAALAIQGVRVVANSHARGLSGARNTGVECTEAPVLIFLDDDAIPQDGWLSNLRAAVAHLKADVVGGAVQPAWERKPAWFPDEFGWVVGCDFIGMPGDGGQIRNPIGASMAIRRTAFTAVGEFTSTMGRIGTLPVGCEETEFCIRLRQHDPSTTIVRSTTSVVDHQVPSERGTVRYFLSRCYHEGRSKSALSTLVGRGDSLSTERSYVTNTLAAGFRRHLGSAPTGGISEIACAGAILLGLGSTVTGYGVQTVRTWYRTRHAAIAGDG